MYCQRQIQRGPPHSPQAPSPPSSQAPPPPPPQAPPPPPPPQAPPPPPITQYILQQLPFPPQTQPPHPTLQPHLLQAPPYFPPYAHIRPPHMHTLMPQTGQNIHDPNTGPIYY